MSTEEKKPPASPSTPPPSTTAPPLPPTTPPRPPPQPTAATKLAKKPVTRRAFLIGAIAASTGLAIGSMASGALPQYDILSPVLPRQLPSGYVIPGANATDLENNYQLAVSALQADIAAGRCQPGTLLNPTNAVHPFATFFYWPYDVAVSPYYRNIVLRLPDEVLDPSIRGSTPDVRHFAAWNTTCVHLRCLVNAGSDDSQYRLLCPCHGSEYRLIDGVPVKGPAFDLGLGLNGLPKVILSLDSNNNLRAERFDGEPGIGRRD